MSDQKPFEVTSHNQQGAAEAFPPGCERIPLLDHGYLQVVDKWGSDEAIVRAARQSTQRGFVSWETYKRCEKCDAVWLQGEAPSFGACQHFDSQHQETHAWKDFPRGDFGILDYLWKNKHSTPFEMAGVTLEVRAPIFVFREWHRHRVPFGYSEASARYAPLPALDYLPTVERLMEAGPARNKQAASAEGSELLDPYVAEVWVQQLGQKQRGLEDHYQRGLRLGIPKELARLAMTVGRYSTMRATGNLRGWVSGFLALRQTQLGSPDMGDLAGQPLPKQTAQKEIRVYADALRGELRRLFPRTMRVAESSP